MIIRSYKHLWKQKHNEFNDMRVSFNMVRDATVMCNSDNGLLVTHINGIPRNN